MVTDSFNSEKDITNTRQSLNDAIGLIALKFGLIPGSIRDALLVGQAAVRALNIADKINDLGVNQATIVQGHIDAKTTIDPKAAGFVAHDDKIFQFVNSEKDSEVLQRAQLLWVAAQNSLNYQIKNVKHNIDMLTKIAPLGTGVSDGYKEAAIGLLKEATSMLKLQTTAGHIIPKKEDIEKAAQAFENLTASIESGEQTPADNVKRTRLTLDKATGDIIAEMGLVAPAVKNAFLAGQGAVRALNLVDKTEAFVSNAPATIAEHRKAETTVDVKDNGLVPFDDTIFKFVGSARDPELLKQGQGLWMIAQLQHNYHLETAAREITAAAPNAEFPRLSPEFGAGIVQQATRVLTTVAVVLEKENLFAAGKKIAALAKSLEGKTAGRETMPPVSTLNALSFLDPNVRQSEAYADKLVMLTGLFSSGPGSNLAPTATPAK